MANEDDDDDSSYHMSFPSITTAAGPGIAPGPWNWEKDPQNETAFYYSRVTEQPHWGESVDAYAPQTYQHYEEDKSTSIQGRKRRWRSFVDNTTGSTYYFDESTGESQWERPIDMHDEVSDGNVAGNWWGGQGAAENTVKTLENDTVIERGDLGTAYETLPDHCQSIDISEGEESTTNRVSSNSGGTSGEYVAPGELRPCPSRVHGSMVTEEQPASRKFPTAAFTAARSPILENDGFGDDFIPEDEPAMLDKLTRRKRLTDYDEMVDGFMDARIETPANEVYEEMPKNESEELEQLHRPKEESCLRDIITARDERKSTSDSDVIGDRAWMGASGFNLDTTRESIAESGAANRPFLHGQNSRDGDKAAGVALDASLPRVDSSSTLSTYGEGLDSLARYVAGHSSNLARSAVVELSIPTQEQECTTSRDDEVQIVQPRNEGSLRFAASSSSDTQGHDGSSTNTENTSKNAEALGKPLESRRNDAGNSAAPSPSQRLSSERAVDEVELQLDESNSFVRGSVSCSSAQMCSEPDSRSGSLDGEDTNPENGVIMTPTTHGQEGISQSFPASSEKTFTCEQPSIASGEDRASVASNPQKEINQSRSSSCSIVEDIDSGTDGTVAHAERRNGDMPQRSDPPGAGTENGLEGGKQIDADSGSQVRDASWKQQLIDSPPAAGLSLAEGVEDGMSEAPPSEFMPSAKNGVQTGESLVPLPSVRKVSEAQFSAPVLDSATVDTIAFQRVQSETLPTSRLEVASVTLQAQVRGWVTRRRFARLLKDRVIKRKDEFEATRLASIAIQANVRGYMVRREYQGRKQPFEDHSSLEGKPECDTASDPREKRRQGSVQPEDVDDVCDVDASLAEVLARCIHGPQTLETLGADSFDRDLTATSQSSEVAGPPGIETEPRRGEYSADIGEEAPAETIKLGATRNVNSYSSINEMPGKQDRNEVHGQQRKEDSRVMGTYAGAPRGISWSGEETIGEEEQQRSSSSRGKSSTEQSSNGEGSPEETTSLHRYRADDAGGEFRGLEDSSDEPSILAEYELTFEVDDGDKNGDNSSHTSEGCGQQGDSSDPADLETTEDRSHLCLATVSSDDNIRQERSSKGAGSGTESDAPSKDCSDDTSTRRSVTTSRSTADDDSQDSLGVWRSTKSSGGKESCPDTTGPGDMLETLRCLVDKQAKAIARLATMAPGTDASRYEALRIRKLAVRQDQAAKDFLGMMNFSIASGSGADSASLAPYVDDCSSTGVGVAAVAVKLMPEGTKNAQQSTSDDLVVDMVEDNVRCTRSHPGDNCTDERDEACNQRKWDHDRSGEEITLGDDQIGFPHKDEVDVLYDRIRSSEEGEAHAGYEAVRAVRALTSESMRLASGQGEAADELAQEMRNACMHRPGIALKGADALDTLGQSVGLMVWAAGLFGEIIAYTIHSRESQRIINKVGARGASMAPVFPKNQASDRIEELDPRLSTFAQLKQEIRRTTESLAKDATSVVAKHEPATRRMEVAPDLSVVGRLAGGIRRLTRVQERLVYQIQQFASSAHIAEFSNVDPDDGEANVAGVLKGVDQDGKAVVEAPQEWIARVTVDLMYKLREGADAGSISSARADATRRERQITRFANELRRIAASQTKASTVLAEVGAQFVAGASTEEPPPHDYIHLHQDHQTCPGKPTLGKMHVIEDTNTIGNVGAVAELSSAAKKSIHVAGAQQDRRQHSTAYASFQIEADRVAITMAAEKEEIVAARRILIFLRRRLRKRPVKASEAATAIADSREVMRDAPSRSTQADACAGDQGAGRLGAAIHTLHEAVDLFFNRNPSSGADKSSTRLTPSSSAHEHRPEYEKCPKALTEISDDTARVSGRSRINIDDDKTSDSVVNDSSDEASDSSWVAFAPVPLRARTPTLYTLPASLVIRGGGGNNYAMCSDKTEIDQITELNCDVATRLPSVRSVFGLGASDVLAAFAPLVTSSLLAVQGPRLRASTPPAVSGCDAPPRTPSPDELRQRLSTEAKDAASAGVGQPWGSTRRLYLPANHRPRQGLHNKVQPRRFRVEGDRIQRQKNSAKRRDMWGPVTALGRRLLVKRLHALREVGRQQMLGVVDALRMRQAERQLRSGVAANALDAVVRALDVRDSKSQEERIPVTHMEQLLGLADRFAFSDSQLCDLRETASPPARRERTFGGATSQSSRCQLCEKLSTDLRGGNPVGRDQSSWAGDKNPFCSRCRNSMQSQSSPNAQHDEGKLQKSSTNHTTLAGGTMFGRDRMPLGPNVTVKEKSSITGSLLGPENAKGVSSVASVAKLKDYLVAELVLPREGYQFKALATERVVAPAATGAATSCHNDLRSQRLPRKADAVVGKISRHLHEVDKYPLDLPRLCRFAQFLTENDLLREAFEVILHAISSSTAGVSRTYRSGGDVSPVQVPILLPPGLEGQLLLVASRLAIAVGRYSEASRYAKAAIHRVTVHAVNDSSALLVASSRVFEKMLDDRSAEIILLGCLLQNPHCSPALSLYGRLAARNSELGIAERYLKRAISLPIDAAKEGVAGREERASDWIALMELMSEMNPSSTRAADAVSYFRKGLACLNWRHPGQATAAPVTQQLAAPSSALNSIASRSTECLLALGRFELLHNHSVKRASGYFKACIKQSPRHASAKIHLACCLLEQQRPFNKSCVSSRALARVDSLLSSILEFKTDDIFFSGASASATSSPAQLRRVHPCAQAVSRVGKVDPFSNHRVLWLLWAFYAKFAERCLGDPNLALFALDRASEAIAASKISGRQIDPKRSGGNVLVARAHLCQRWPELLDAIQLGRNIEGRTTLESMFVDVTERFPHDPSGHTALGYFLLSRDVGSPSIDLLDRAIIAFRRALSIPGCCNNFVPATRGLAVVSRRFSLLQSVGRHPLSDFGQFDTRVHKENEHNGSRIPGDILLRELEATGTRRRDNVALLRTAAMHLYTWRLTADPHGSFPSVVSTDSKVSVAMGNPSLGESHAEALLTRAVDLEPFHVPTLTVLAFVLLQRGAVARAQGMLERAVKCAGRRAVPRDVLRAVARIHASQGRRSTAIYLLRRATVVSAGDKTSRDDSDRSRGSSRGDPLSLCRLGQLLLASNIHTPPPSPISPAFGSVGVSPADVEIGPETEPKSVPIMTPPATPSKVQISPSDDDKADAARLFARALVAAGGAAPSENDLLEQGVGRVTSPTVETDDVFETRARDHKEESAMWETLAEVHLVLSGCGIKGDGIDTAVSQHRIGSRTDKPQRWHLQEAAKAGANTKAGLTARYALGQHALAAGDDRKAEMLFLEALDAEPMTYGACAAFLAVLGQVSVDNAYETMRLRRLRRRLRFNKGKPDVWWDVSNNKVKKTITARFSQRLEQAQRSVKLLKRLEVYASLRKRYVGDRLRGTGLMCPEWALALDEGWETRYTTVLEGGDGWAAMHCLD